MWIAKPIVAFISGLVFVVSVLITAVGTAILLAIDIPTLSALTRAEVLTFVSIAVSFMLLSAGSYTLRQFVVNRTLRMKLDDRRDLQRRIDQLARLRSAAINDIYSGTPKPDEFDGWKSRYSAWEKEAEAFLKKNFPFAVVEMFADLGAIIP